MGGVYYRLENEKKLVQPLNFTFRYIDDVLSLNNSKFGDCVDCIYPIAQIQLDLFCM